MPTPVQLKRNGTPGASAPSSLLHGELALNYGDARIFWRDASNVIQSFTFQSYALASHTHSISDVTGLQTALDGKAASSHTHSISDVTGLQTALDGKASSSHTHAASDITSGTLDIARIPTGTSSSHVCIGNDARLSDTRTPTDGSVTTAKIANDAVTYAKIQNVSATDRLLGRSSAGAGDVEEITCTSFGRSLIDDADAEAARTTLSVQPTAGPSFTAGITVTQAMASPTVVLRNTAADATDKAAQVVGAHYTATEETVQGIGIYSTATENLVAIGGGSALSNAASEVRLYTAANATTTTGTIRLTISSTGTATFSGQIVGQAGAAITGAATFANTGDVVPLTVTNAGTANSFVVNDASGDTTPFVIDASGQVGIGTSAPQRKLHIANDGAEGLEFFVGIFSGESRINAFNRSSSSWNKFSIGCSTLEFFVGSGGTSALAFSSTGTATFAGQVLVTAGSVSACSVAPSGDPNTGLYFPAANVAAVVTDGVERVRVDASGYVIIPKSGSGTTGPELVLRNTASLATSNACRISFLTDSGASVGGTPNGAIDCINTGGGGASSLAFSTWNGSAIGERMRIDASGNVGIGGSPNRPLLIVNNGSCSMALSDTSTGGNVLSFNPPQNSSGFAQISAEGANALRFVTNAGERMRIDASGNVLVGQSTTADPAGANTNGIALAPDYISVSRSSFECLRLNIKAADGTIVALFQDAALEGSISVAGNTVSYNAFCGSHWAQLSDQSRPAILRGTVMETIDEMCDWPEDGGSSDRLVRVKVSDTQSSRRVYGVFLGWDGQYASTGDMYVAGLGAYMVRVSGVVQSGDLLESAGDGTARTQADDIVRSTTIGKVSSTHRIAEYDDGSYLVPCVLMCG